MKAAKSAYSRRTSWRFGGGCAGAFSLVGAALGMFLLRLDSAWATTFATGFFLLATPLALVFITGLLKSARYSKELSHSIASAWNRAARDVALNAPTPVDASTVAEALGSTESEADRWLTELSVGGALRSEITDDGRIVYHRSGRVRVDIGHAREPGQVEPASATSDEEAELEARFAELARREANRNS